MQSDFPDFAPLEEEEEEALRGYRRLSNFERTQKVLSNVPVLGWVINWWFTVFHEKIMQVRRRRKSYKLALFFQAQMILSLVGFLIFFIVGMQDLSLMSDSSRVEAECVLPSTLAFPDGSVKSVYDSARLAIPEVLYNYTQMYRKPVGCTNEKSTDLDAACSLSDFKLLVQLMIVTAVFFLIGMVVSWIVFSGFKFFSNIPMESLNVEATSCKVTFLGTMCRHGPWLSRSLTVINIGLVITLVCLPTVGSMCAGSISLTHSCISVFDDCAEQQFNNCRYYYSSNCVGAYLPHGDATSIESSFQQCKNPEFAAKFSGRFDARIVLPSVCARCWTLHSDCLDVDINRVRFVNDPTDSSFVYVNTASVAPVITPGSDLAEVVYCNCLQNLDAAKTAVVDLFNATALTGKSSVEDLKNLVCTSTEVNGTTLVSITNALTQTTCPATTLSQSVPPAIPVDESANIFSPNFQDAVFDKVPAQECDWASDTETAYFFDTTECSQAGSTLNRYVFVTSYVTVTLMGLLLIAGMSVRHSVRPETWSYSPQNPHEPWYWKALRAIGPG